METWKRSKNSQVHLLHISFLSEAIKRRRTRERESNEKCGKKFFSGRVSINKNSHVCRSFWNDDFWYENYCERRVEMEKKLQNYYDLSRPPLSLSLSTREWWVCKSMKFHCPVGRQAQKRQSLSALNGAITYIYNPNLSRRLFRVQSAFVFADIQDAHPQNSATFPINLGWTWQAGARQKTLKLLEDNRKFNWKLKQLWIIMLIPKKASISHDFIAYHEVYFIFIVFLVFFFALFYECCKFSFSSRKMNEKVVFWTLVLWFLGREI
jgi:hypothetical protein